MSQFGHLAKLDVSEDVTVAYEFISIPGNPCLKVLPATESNKKYFNIVLKNSSKKRRHLKTANADLIASHREDDKALYPKYIIKDWSNVMDEKGKMVDYTEEAVQDFLECLPNHFFDELREFCSDVSNFTKEAIEQDEELIKNSAPVLPGSTKLKKKAGQ